jgi:hypothetical protein
VAAFLAGPGFAWAADAPARESGRAAAVEFEPGTIAPSEYVVIERLPVGRWSSAVYVPTYANAESARSALLETAGRIGGDGVVNLYCLASTAPGAGLIFGGHYCYGNVVKLK